MFLNKFIIMTMNTTRCIDNVMHKLIMRLEMSIHISGSKKLMLEDSTLYDKLLAALAELIGTAILVFLGCMACIGSMEESPKQLQIAFAFGMTIMICIQVRFICSTTNTCYFFSV